jgi:peroxiredoxin
VNLLKAIRSTDVYDGRRRPGAKEFTAMLARLVLPALFAAVVAVPAASTAEPKTKPTANFTLTDSTGKKWTLHDQTAKAVVVVFLAAECPMSNGYLPALADLHAKYADKGVTLVGVFPDAETTAAQLAAHAKEYKVPFPLFADHEQVAVTALGAKTTPEAVVLDGTFTVRYRGRIDDRYVARQKPKATVTRHDLTVALDELLAGKAVTIPETKAFGCPIAMPEKKAADTTVTFYKDVLPVLQNHCQACHRPGQVGPFSLTSYKQAAKWAELCLEEVKAKRMPPWKPEKNPLLVGERTLPTEAAKVLETWVTQGMPEGNPKDAPPAVTHTDDWAFGKPDLILEAPGETTIAATGRDTFRVIVFPTNLPEDTYITALEVKPGNPRVVHHTLQLIDTLGLARKFQAEAAKTQKPDDPDRGPGYAVSMGFGFLPDISKTLGGWAPGMLPKKLPVGVGQILPKGADLCLHVHYHRTGKVETDRTKIGLYFAKKPVTERYTWVPVGGLFWSIPAGAKNYKVESAWQLRDDITVYRVLPHMHLLGKDIELTATPPGGKEQMLIRIPVWDYNWQEQYDLKEPLKLPRGTVLRVRSTYDNSADNPNNPHSPPQVVRLGEQTTNEMCLVGLGVTASGPFPQVMLPVFKKSPTNPALP